MLALYTLLFTSIRAEKKVSLGVYFEACCPDSQIYIANSLASAWETDGFQDIVDITLVPWGHETYNKSEQTGQYSYQCQHGPNECIGQRIESCASLYLKPNAFVDFIIALETEMLDVKCQNSTHCCDPTEMSQSIAEKQNMPWREIETCINTAEIADMSEMLQYKSTTTLDPLLTWVPWITLQGNHTSTIQSECVQNTLQCVCAEYHGTSPACKKN
eukprot:239_1